MTCTAFSACRSACGARWCALDRGSVQHHAIEINAMGGPRWPISCYARRMQSTMPKMIPLALLVLAMTTGAALAQQRTFYDARGNVVGRSATDSQGTVTTYDPRGNVVARESTTGSTTTIYDASGRNVGRFTTNR